MSKPPPLRAAWFACGCLFLQAAAAEETLDQRYSDDYREEIIVTATYTAKPIREIGSAVSTITSQDIEARQSLFAADLIRELPGVAVSRGGGVGSLTQARMRGAESNHTLFLIDGIEVNDPAFGSEYNLADTLTFGVDRIEVIRGPQSALYGSDAIGGVISIISEDPMEGLRVQGVVQGGTFATRSYAGKIAGRSGRVFGAITANHYDTDGISASVIQGEKDGYETDSLHAMVGVDLSDQISISLVVRQSDNEIATDTQDFNFPPTPTQGLVIDADNNTESTQRYALIELDVASTSGNWRHNVQLGYTDTESNSFVDITLDSGALGQRSKLAYRSTYLFGDARSHAVTAGIAHEELDFENVYPSIAGANFTADDNQTSFVTEYAVNLSANATMSISGRHDNNDRFDDATTLRATGSYSLPGYKTRFHASFGQGITNPTFTELFGFTPSSFVGNPELQPEESVGWDIGIEQAMFAGRGLLDLTLFSADLEGEITTVFDFATFTSTAVNQIGESDREGAELSAAMQINANWHVSGSYTYLDASDPDGNIEVRRPKHSGSVNATYHFGDGRGLLNVGAIYSGEQEDAEFIFATPESRAALAPYTLLNVALRYAISDRLDIFVRGENVLDEEYTEVFGFRSPGRAVMAGVTLSN